MELNEYIKNSKLAEPAPEFMSEMLESDREAEHDTKNMQAAVNGGSILSFVDGLTAQDRDDVLFSTQFAQRVASANFDRVLEVANWYSDYVQMLEILGWVVPRFGFNQYNLDAGDLKMDAAALEIVAAIATGGQTAILRKTLDVLGGLADDSTQIKLFDFHSSVQFGGNFQMGAVQKAEDGVLSVALGAFHYKSLDRRRGILFFRWGRQTVNFWTSAQTLTLNQTLYGQVRETVADKLGESARTFIADIKLS
jgi:hypothetical protein